jgi:peptide/nickel transport system permease protein
MAASPVEARVDVPIVTLGPAAPGAWTTLGRFLRRKPLGAAGGIIMMVMVVTAVLAPWLQTHDPIATEAAYTLGRPNADHWLGTDHLGRDIYSRIVHGAWVSLVVGLGSTLLGSVLGGIIGLLSGYIGGKTDLIVQRFLDILQGLPLLVLALVMSASLGPSIRNVIIAISIPIIPRAARVIRASVLSIREMQYVEAARALGAGDLRILWFHVLANSLAPLIVRLTFVFASAILAEAVLSYIGVGPPPPAPSFGNIIANGRDFMVEAPWVTIFPGMAIVLCVLGLNLLGDGLRDLLDPRIKVGP